MKNGLKRLLCLLLAATLATVPVWPCSKETLPAAAAATTDSVYCNVRFTSPAICCDAGDTIDLTKCAVQFSENAVMTKSGISWSMNGQILQSFSPAARGVYTLTAKAGSCSKTVYVVAKSPEETEYVLYRNDFDIAPSDYRIPEKSHGGSVYVADSNYILDASVSGDSHIRMLLPAFLDAFGDATFNASVKICSPVNSTKWASLMYRVQGGNYPYYQGCMRSNTAVDDGVEISLRSASNMWEVYQKSYFAYTNSSNYNLCSVTVKGTSSVFSINGRQILEYSNTGFVNGGYGVQTRGTKLMIDYVEVTLDGNAPLSTACDVSFGKPAIRADIGDTIDLTKCDVQFTANAIYTKGNSITWRRDGTAITSLTPSSPGITTLTATSGGVTKNVYVVTRTPGEGEYVLYYNDFNAAPTDYRVVQNTSASIYHDGAGHYVIDASSTADSYGRVLLPAFLDQFGDFKMEARYMDSAPVDARKWSAMMAHVQNNDYPYIQFCVRSDATAVDGVEITQKDVAAQKTWNVRNKGTFTSKISNDYNTYTLLAQNNMLIGRINGTEAISFNEHPHVVGAMGFQARGLKLTIDYVKITLGETSALQDTAVRCTVSKSRPAIGCNAGQTILLDQCPVQFTYGSYPVSGSQITWKKDGKVITEFSDTSVGTHILTATHGHTTMDVYIVAKQTTEREYILYNNDFTTGPTDYRVPEASNGGSVYPINGTFVLNGSASPDAYIRVLLPAYLDQFGDLYFEASIRLSNPTDSAKWGAVMYRTQNATTPYLQCCYRYDSTSENGVEISQRTTDGTWNVLQKGPTTAHNAGVYNVIQVNTSSVQTDFSINGTKVLTATNTPYHNGSWGFHVRGLTMTVDYVRLSFTSNASAASIYTIPGGYVDVRDPGTGISAAPALITEIKTKADLENILTDCPAIAIMRFDVVDGVAKIVFSDGVTTPDQALDKLGSKVIPAFRINDNTDADRLAAFLQGRGQRDAYAVSDNLAVLKRAYTNWKYIRGVADFSGRTSFDPESIRYDALAHSARVLILPESASKEAISKIQESYSCVWLAISAGKTASVAATNKGPYGLITPDRSLTEYCYRTYYADGTLVRRTSVIGHRGNPSLTPENTILSMQTAYNNGANMVENDIYLTTDNVIVVMHDAELDRTTNGSGNVTEMTSDQVLKYKVDYFSGVAAQPIPTLEDYFKAIKNQPDQKLVIEMKHPADARLANALTAMIQKYDIMDQVVVISFIQTNLVNTSNNLPGIPVGWLNWLNLDENNPVYSTYEVLENIQSYNCVCNPGYSGFGDAAIRELYYRGVTLWPWTVNNQVQFDHLILDGVAGITTDYSQWSAKLIESIHWNTANRVISSTYQGVLTDITDSVEVVVIEDTLGIHCSAGNITVPETVKGGKASFYYRYKQTTPTGLTYYTVTEIRTIEVATQNKLELINGSSLTLSESLLSNVTEGQTVTSVKSQFTQPVVIRNASGTTLSDNAKVTTGSTVSLSADSTQSAVIIIKGDVNGDGIIDSTDYLRIKSYFLQTASLSGPYLQAADCDGDGTVSSTDYLRMKAHFLGNYNLFF